MKIQNQVKFIKINNDQEGQRIDNFLFTYLKNVPKSMIYRIIRKGQVRINNIKVIPKYKIQIKDFIRIPPIRLINNKQNFNLSKLDKITMLTNCILYEDEYLIVLNKPSGIAVHGGSGLNFGVIEALRALRSTEHFLELVHRLDRETSGILLIAKKRLVLKALHEQLRLKQIKKQYLALLKGQWPVNIKVIYAPLLKNILKSGERIVKVDNNGKYSETHFKIKELFYNTTLVKIMPITGRTHQIRVHAQYAKHPIACDNRYGDFDFNKKLKIMGLNRLFLHAISLTFIHPISEKKMTFNGPLDKQLESYLIKLRKR
ncbi:MAG: 23S rRNA pseudouridine(955/2504/2580) synthase RluC [Arsenophonus endosymbiont of Ceratovacuna japonica]